MLNAVIKFSLHQRAVVIAIAVFLLALGVREATRLPIDVFPDLNRPRVTVMTEAPGLAPEEIETLITYPIESALNGATGVLAVRSASHVGLSVIQVEFDWGTDVYINRQVVKEKLDQVKDGLPKDVEPQLAPISSIMGQIMIVGMWSEGDVTPPLEVRTTAETIVRQRLKVEGVAEVFVMGGGRKQFQVLVDPLSLAAYGVTIHDVEAALVESNANVTGGYMVGQGPNELLVRGIGRLREIDDLKTLVVKKSSGRAILLDQVAKIKDQPQVTRGDAAAYVRNGDGSFSGGAAVVLTITKQPDADTRLVTQRVTQVLDDLRPTLSSDMRIHTELYQQEEFIDRAIVNVEEALRDGSILVVIILVMFLLNARTTLITLTAIPLSIVVTVLVFKLFGMSVNTMTLGGLAVAIGELVDDAIVDVENIYRRLRENSLAAEPKPALLVVYQASVEIRNSIVYGTLIVVVVFMPLFALTGMEGKLFPPLAVAYIVSLLASLLVSLTVTPVLSYWLLRRVPAVEHKGDGFVVTALKKVAGPAIRFSLAAPWLVLGTAAAAVALGVLGVMLLQRDFLPEFDEGSVQVGVVLMPGTSLEQSKQVARIVDASLKEAPYITAFVSKSGRAELDEHVMGVNETETIISIDPNSGYTRKEIVDDLRRRLGEIPGVSSSSSVEQPLAHLISAMISGEQAKVAIRIFGDDLDILRRKANEVKAAIEHIPGVVEPQVEKQAPIPQLRIEVDRNQLALHQLTPQDVTELVETAMNGRVVSEVLRGQQTFELVVKLDEEDRENLANLRRLAIDLPAGGTVPLAAVANIYRAAGPNQIKRERVRRNIVVKCNTSDRGLVDVVEDIKRQVEPVRQSLPSGYSIEYGGQFESAESASRAILIWFSAAIAVVFLLLYVMFRSANFALQVMVALPTAFIGAVAALWLTGQTLTIASMVGFISLCGIAARNGILLLNHYLHLVRYEGESWSKEMMVRAGLERLSPVLMTALATGIGLAPLAIAAGEPGKEILYPVATVIIGGLITSTVLEFFVRPALCWQFGRAAGERLVRQRDAEIELVEEHAARG